LRKDTKGGSPKLDMDAIERYFCLPKMIGASKIEYYHDYKVGKGQTQLGPIPSTFK
jgi:hypothetical protein